MTLSFYCPSCGDVTYNTGIDLEDVGDNESYDFACESCPCEFTVTYHSPTVNITVEGDKQ